MNKAQIAEIWNTYVRALAWEEERVATAAFLQPWFSSMAEGKESMERTLELGEKE